MKIKLIYIGSDHAGFKLKEKIKHRLNKHNIPFQDLGNLKYNPDDDYPDFAKKVANAVVRTNSLGILLCGSAQGMAIAANKIKGVRAVIPFSLKEARLSREHNNANIICLSGWHTHFHRAAKMLEKFLTTPFSQEPRHLRRLNKIKRLER
jgi:ribose 5-phosphate isomerase B